MLRLNLLPPQQKERFEWEKSRRLALVSSAVITLFSILFGALLASSALYNKIQLEPFREAIEKEKIREETLRVENIESITRDFFGKLRKIRDVQTKTDDYEGILQELAALPPEGVVFYSLAISEINEGLNPVKTVQLTGHADTRNRVIAMENKIKSSGKFIDLVSPFSNKNKEENINFTFSFKISNSP